MWCAEAVLKQRPVHPSYKEISGLIKPPRVHCHLKALLSPKLTPVMFGLRFSTKQIDRIIQKRTITASTNMRGKRLFWSSLRHICFVRVS